MSKIPLIDEGLPQLGSECEVQIGRQEKWRIAKIKFIGDDILVAQVGEQELCWRLEYCTFRPVRTPEQNESVEREQAIEEMATTAHIPGQPFMTKREVAARLYDAGYRKQVMP